ncbi:hypothetical protein ZIOFF_010681 [Zingiber officinale]|uniref:Uncharacterized protein n=1 Tax=Zingiber officinale TaxID=94328 RepID=A0A8J5HJ46_ZINOF|nr:hypothetical protein ZIOFF_010681 [Zingiber officinale]
MSPHLFELKRLRSLSLFRCFTDQSVAGGASVSGLAEAVRKLRDAGVPIQRRPERRNPARSRPALKPAVAGSGGEFINRAAAAGAGELGANSLSGPLPPSILSMNALLKLDLSSNQLNGQLPVAKQGSLTLLNLRNNNFSGVAGVAGMAALQYLLLSDNPLRANLAELGLENLRNLIALDLSNTSLRGEIPRTIAKLRRLRFVALNDNDLSGRVPKSLEYLTELHGLYLSGNNLRGELEFSDEFYARMRSSLLVGTTLSSVTELEQEAGGWRRLPGCGGAGTSRRIFRIKLVAIVSQVVGIDDLYAIEKIVHTYSIQGRIQQAVTPLCRPLCRR